MFVFKATKSCEKWGTLFALTETNSGVVLTEIKYPVYTGTAKSMKGILKIVTYFDSVLQT